MISVYGNPRQGKPPVSSRQVTAWSCSELDLSPLQHLATALATDRASQAMFSQLSFANRRLNTGQLNLSQTEATRSTPNELLLSSRSLP